MLNFNVTENHFFRIDYLATSAITESCSPTASAFQGPSERSALE
jgi:hypothetical protein